MRKFLKLVSLTMLLFCVCSCANDTVTPEEAHCSIEIGVVMDVNGIDDNGYNQLVWQGVTNYAKSALLSTSCFKYFESTTEEDYVQYLRTFADSVDIVIAASPAMSEDLSLVANEFPRVTFVIVDTEVEGKNIVSLNYDEKLLTFVAGKAALNYITDASIEHVAFIGDSIELAAIFEQAIHLVDENIHIEYEFDELHNYDNVVVTYDMLGTTDFDTVVISSSIHELENTIKKNISDDVYNIIKEKDRRKLSFGNYNSTNISLILNDVDIARESKNIVNNKDFSYATIPSFMIKEENVEIDDQIVNIE